VRAFRLLLTPGRLATTLGLLPPFGDRHPWVCRIRAIHTWYSA